MQLEYNSKLKVLEAEGNEKVKELSDKVKELSAFKDVAAHVQRSLEKVEKENKKLVEKKKEDDTKLKLMQRKELEMDKKYRKLNTKYEDVNKELKDLTVELESLKKNRNVYVTEIQKEHLNNHKKAELEWKKKTDVLVENTKNELHALLDGRIENLEKELNQVVNNEKHVRCEYNALSKEYDELAIIHQEDMDKYNNLEVKCTKDRISWNVQKLNFEEQFAEFQNKVEIQHMKYDTLMEKNLELNKEISAYQAILEREENRFGIPYTKTPAAKKRKSPLQTSTAKKAKASPKRIHFKNAYEARTPNSQDTINTRRTRSSSSKKKKQMVKSTASGESPLDSDTDNHVAFDNNASIGSNDECELNFSEVDRNSSDTYVVYDNIFISALIPEENTIKIKNASPYPIALTDWSVSSLTSNHQFSFPEFTLPSNGVVTVICGSNGRKNSRQNVKNVFYTKRAMWTNEDIATLKDDSGNTVDQYVDHTSEPEIESEVDSDKSMMDAIESEEESADVCISFIKLIHVDDCRTHVV